MCLAISMPGTLVLDTEFNPRPFRLISAGFVRLDKHGRPRCSQHFLVRPEGYTIDEAGVAFSVHGITQAHAASHGVPMRQLVAWLTRVLPMTTRIVGHNVRRDIALLKEEAARVGAGSLIAQAFRRVPVTDTMHMARERGFDRLSLSSVYCRVFGVHAMPEAHDALADARHTAAVYRRLIESQPCQQRPITAFIPRQGISA